jgi:hypothetical protein
MFAWHSQALDAVNGVFTGICCDAKNAAASKILNDDDLVNEVITRFRGKHFQLRKILDSESMKEINSFELLSQTSQLDSIGKIFEKRELIDALVSQVTQSKEVIEQILSCSEVQNEITFDHIRKGSNKQYSLARILRNKEMMHRLSVQLRHDQFAVEQILLCDAIRGRNSFEKLSKEKQIDSIKKMQSDSILIHEFIMCLTENTSSSIFIDILLIERKVREMIFRGLLHNVDAAGEFLGCEAVKRLNSFTALSLTAKTKVMMEIVRNIDLLKAFTSHLQDHEGAIVDIINSDVIQSLLTIDHIGDEKCIQYSIVRFLNTPRYLDGFLHQLQFNDKAISKILNSKAIREKNSIEFLTDVAKRKTLDLILTNEPLRQLAMNQLQTEDAENAGKDVNRYKYMQIREVKNDQNQPAKGKSCTTMRDDVVNSFLHQINQEKSEESLIKIINAAVSRLSEISRSKSRDADGMKFQP